MRGQDSKLVRGQQPTGALGMGPGKQGMVALWALGTLALISGLMAVCIPLLTREDAYRAQRIAHIRAQALARYALEQARLELEDLEATAITGTWSHIHPEEKIVTHSGVYAWDARTQTGRWLGGLGAAGFEALAQGPSMETLLHLGDGYVGPQMGPNEGYSYAIQAADMPAYGRLWDPLSGSPQKPLDELLKAPEASENPYASHWRALMQAQRPLKELPLVLRVGLRVEPTQDAQHLEGLLELTLANPFSHSLWERLQLQAQVCAYIDFYDADANFIDSDRAELDFMDPALSALRHYRIEPGRTQTIRLRASAPLRPLQRAAWSYSLELDVNPTGKSSLILGPSSPRPRHYTLAIRSQHRTTRRLSETPTPLAYWNWNPATQPSSGPLLTSLNLQPHRAILIEGSKAPTWPLPGAPLLEPMRTRLEHIGQLCRAAPGRTQTDPTWLFGTALHPAQTLPSNTTSPGHLEPPTPAPAVHTLAGYSVWDQAFIAPMAGSPSPFYKKLPNGQLFVREPLNVNSATPKQWKRALDTPSIRSFLRENGCSIHHVLEPLAQALGKAPQRPYASVQAYIESNAFQNALNTCGLHHLWQSAFLEHIGPRLCVRSDTFLIRAQGQALTPNKHIRTKQLRFQWTGAALTPVSKNTPTPQMASRSFAASMSG